jgi:hypothetical protein
MNEHEGPTTVFPIVRGIEIDISIITPTLNSEGYIRGAIESVQKQNGVSIEHIVVDGGSTDGTLGIVRSYPGIRCIVGTDCSMYDAINKGIRSSAGSVIAYINADDRYCSGALDLVVQELAKDQSLDFVYGNCRYISEEGQSLGVFRPLPYSIAKWNLRVLWLQQSWFWRRSLHEKIGYFDTSLKALGDTDFMRRAVEAGAEGKLIPRCLAEYMLRPGALSCELSSTVAKEMSVSAARHNIGSPSIRRMVCEILNACININTFPCRLKFRCMARRNSVVAPL